MLCVGRGPTRVAPTRAPTVSIIQTDGSASLKIEVRSTGDACYQYIHRLIDSGWLRKVSGSDQKVITALLRFIDGKRAKKEGRLIAFPTVAQLAKSIGRQRGTVTDSIRRLIDLKILNRVAIGGWEKGAVRPRGSTLELAWPPHTPKHFAVWAQDWKALPREKRTPPRKSVRTPPPKSRRDSARQCRRGARARPYPKHFS